MRIERISIKNYKVLRDTTIEHIGGMAVFLGRNGSGKTTLFDVFGFLKKCLNENISSALLSRGGYSEVHSRESDGHIEFEFKYRPSPSSKLCTYLLIIGQDNNGRPYIVREVLRYRRASQSGAPWNFIDFSNGVGEAITNEDTDLQNIQAAKRERFVLDSPDILAIKSLGQMKKFPAAAAFRKFIEDWFVSDFQIDTARQVQDLSYNDQLTRKGDNLANVAKFMHDNHPERFISVLTKMRERIPGVHSVEAKPTEDGRIVLRFSDEKFQDPFNARFVSDGTIKMFAYLMMLANPKPHSLLCIEEPENQLYPELLPILAEEFRIYTESGGQVFISTHAPEFVNALRIDEVYAISKKEGYSQIYSASDKPLVKSLYDAGDQLGQLWIQNIL